MQEFNSFGKGVRDGIPIFVAYFAVSFTFGIAAVSAGLDIFESVLISMTNLTSAGQLAGVGVIASGGTIIEMVLTQLIINLRYSLMSLTLTQKLSNKVGIIDRVFMSFFVTDEIFAVSVSKPGLIGKIYFYGLSLMPYIGWSLGTFLGAVAGNVLPAVLVSSLGIAIYGMFIAIIVPPAKKSLTIALCMLTAIVIGCVLRYVPVFKGISDGFIVIISAVISSILFAVIKPVRLEETEGD